MARPHDTECCWRDRLEAAVAASNSFPFVHWATLGMAWSIRKRLASVMFPAAALWLAGIMSLHATALALRWYSPRAYRRWRQTMAVASRVYGGGFGAAFLLLRKFFDSVHASDGIWPQWLAQHWAYECARHAALLLMASTLCPMLVWASTVVPLSWAVPLQLTSTAQTAYFNAHICSSESLSSARTQDFIHAIFGFLDSMYFGFVPSTLVPPPSPTAQCCTLLAAMQLSLGLVAPLVAQAILEASLFRQHQAERAAADLPPEKGWQAQMYDHVNSFVDAFQMNPGSALACAWVLAGVLWKVAVALSVNQAASYAAGQGGGAAVGAAAASLVF